MYKKFYSLKANPFPVQLSAGRFFEAESHVGCLDFVAQSMTTGQSCILITGESGVGKTLLFQKVVGELKVTVSTDRILSYAGPFDLDSFYDQLFVLRGIETHGVIADSDEKYQLLCEALESYRDSEEHYVILDNADRLDALTLSHIVQLFVGKDQKGKLIIFAHSSFQDLLQLPSLSDVKQAVAGQYELAPFSREEVEEYIYFSLIEAGGGGRPTFLGEAVDKIYSLTSGVPALVNQLCEKALLAAYGKESDLIREDFVPDTVEQYYRTDVQDLYDMTSDEPPLNDDGRPSMYTGVSAGQSATGVDGFGTQASSVNTSVGENKLENKFDSKSASFLSSSDSFIGKKRFSPRAVLKGILALLFISVVIFLAQGRFFKSTIKDRNVPSLDTTSAIETDVDYSTVGSRDLGGLLKAKSTTTAGGPSSVMIGPQSVEERYGKVENNSSTSSAIIIEDLIVYEGRR